LKFVLKRAGTAMYGGDTDTKVGFPHSPEKKKLIIGYIIRTAKYFGKTSGYPEANLVVQ
jgi:hypothetical protein